MCLWWCNNCTCGSEEVMYLLVLCKLFSWPVVIICLYLFCSYHVDGRGAVVPYVIEITAVTVTM